MVKRASSPSPASLDPLLTLKEVARLLGVHASTVARWHRDGLVNTVRVGRKLVRVTRDEVQRLMARGKTA